MAELVDAMALSNYDSVRIYPVGNFKWKSVRLLPVAKNYYSGSNPDYTTNKHKK